MPEVKKREKIPEALQPPPMPTQVAPEELVIQIKDETWPLPHLSLKRYRKLLKLLEADEAKFDDMSESERINSTIEFYYTLLKEDHPELKKADLEEMPIFQFGGEFLLKLKIAMFRVPLHS